jgi:hypothetical protein
MAQVVEPFPPNARSWVQSQYREKGWGSRERERERRQPPDHLVIFPGCWIQPSWASFPETTHHGKEIPSKWSLVLLLLKVCRAMSFHTLLLSKWVSTRPMLRRQGWCLSGFEARVFVHLSHTPFRRLCLSCASTELWCGAGILSELKGKTNLFSLQSPFTLLGMGRERKKGKTTYSEGWSKFLQPVWLTNLVDWVKTPLI